MIEVDNLRKSYRETEALKGISFRVARGEIIGLVGPNGAGKTTAMKILTGYMVPTSGTAVVAGTDVVRDPIAAQRRLGYLPENAPVYHDMLVQEYLEYVATLRGIPRARIRARIAEVVRMCNLEDRLAWVIGHLSKGYRQRVGIAQAIIHDPEILVLDEPTAGLDPNQIFDIRDLIRHLGRDKTVILSTHILSEVEATCTRAIILIDGLIQADSVLADLQGKGAAIVAVADPPADAADRLAQVAGVTRVEGLAGGDGVRRFRVHGEGDLTARLFQAVKERGYTLVELRRDEHRLEDVFRSLTGRG